MASTIIGFAVITAELAGSFGYRIELATLCLLIATCFAMFAPVVASSTSLARDVESDAGDER